MIGIGGDPPSHDPASSPGRRVGPLVVLLYLCEKQCLGSGASYRTKERPIGQRSVLSDKQIVRIRKYVAPTSRFVLHEAAVHGIQ